MIISLVGLLSFRDENMWIFCSAGGKKFNGNSKYLYSYCENKADVRNIWIGKDKDLIEDLNQEGFEAYYTGTIKTKIILLRAGVVFYTHGIIDGVYLSGARHINLTHGNYLKHMGMDKPGRVSHLMNLQSKISVYLGRPETLYLLTSSGKPLDVMERAYGIKKENALVCGFPRTDIFFKEFDSYNIGIINNDLEKLIQVSEKKDIIFWAPTHRRGFGTDDGKSIPEIVFNMDDVDDFLSDNDYKLYISLHPHSTISQDVSKFENIEHLNTGGDIYPYLNYCDLLITDYSGIFYDYLLLDRPIVFYSPDLNEYNEERGMYFDYESHVPGPVCEDTDDLVQSISRIVVNDNWTGEREELTKEYHRFSDGNSSERVYKNINNIIK